MWWEGYRVSGGGWERAKERVKESQAPMLVGFWPSLCSDPVTVEQVISTWVEQDRGGKGSRTEGEKGSAVGGLKGHMTLDKTTQQSGVKPQSNIHYIWGTPFESLPLPRKYTITLKMASTSQLPSLSYSHPFLHNQPCRVYWRCGWPVGSGCCSFYLL